MTIEGSTSLAFSEDVGDAVSRPMAGTCCACATRMTRKALNAALDQFAQRDRAGPPSSSWRATSATARRTSRTPRRRTASRWARTRSAAPSASTAGRRMRKFLVPDGVYEHFAEGIGARGAKLRERVGGAVRALPRAASRISRTISSSMQRRDLPEGWEDAPAEFPADPKGLATRDSSGKVLNALAEKCLG